MKRQYADLVKTSRQIMATADPELRAEVERISAARYEQRWLPDAASALEGITAPAPASAPEAQPDFQRESIILRVGRPVLAIVGGSTQLEFQDEASAVWKRRLEAGAGKLGPAIAAIGRIEVENFLTAADYLGTGWLIDRNILVTNRHVAQEFAARGPSGFVFRNGLDRRRPIGVKIDFLEEIGGRGHSEFPITDVLYIAPQNRPDVAFLRVRTDRLSARPIQLATEVPAAQTAVAVIGYPAKDSRIPERELMDRIFGAVYDKKRSAPGFTTGTELGSLLHDCTTLGGNSGSAVIDLATGEAVALHYAGTFLRTNFAVPAPAVKALLDEAMNTPIEVKKTTDASEPKAQPRDTVTYGAHDVRISIPLEISVRLGAPSLRGDDVKVTAGDGRKTAGTTTQPPAGPVSESSLERAVNYAREALRDRPDVVSVDPGYQFVDGWITDQRAVVVSVQRKRSLEDLQARGLLPLPVEFLGVPVDVTVAAVTDTLEQREGVDFEAAKWVSNYKKRPDLSMKEVTAKMRAVLHLGPDAGWKQLESFLGRVSGSLVVGMYDFTAPHIVGAVKQAPGALQLVLQAGESLNNGTKADDIPDESTVEQLRDTKGAAFQQAWASVKGADRLFDSSYHIKLAVRDGAEFWLSSGSWQSSNQPTGDPIDGQDPTPPLLTSHNREWHVVLKHDGLSALFAEHLERDLADAKALESIESVAPPLEVWVPIEYFQPTENEARTTPKYFAPLVLDRSMRVTPVLTPDNYVAAVLPLINSAQNYIYFQNQSLSILEENSSDYERLLDALLKKQRDDVEVRIIFRRFGDMRKNLTAIKDFGFDMDFVRLQTNCHTKGIVVDGEAVLVGSHNWTNAGTVFNRDASLIFRDGEVAQYFEQAFLFDWNRIGRPRLDESVPAVELVRGDEGVARSGMIRVPLHRWLGN